MFGKKKHTPSFDTELRMHGSVTVGTKGQIVIPKEARDMLAIEEGDSLLTITKYGKYVGFVRTDDIPELLELLKQEYNM